MPISQAFFRRSNALLLAIGIAVLVGIVATSLWLTSASERYFGEVTAARAVRSATADLLSLVQDAETGQRGFLLTREEAYLEPYNVALSKLAAQRGNLERAAAKLREVGPLLQRVTSELDQKMAELAATVEATRKGDTETALRMVRSGTGKQLMDDLRTDLTAILTNSEAELREAIDAQLIASTRLRWTTIIGAILILAMAGAASWTIISYTRELVAARREVETLNVGLEERVRERTDALVKANEEVQRFAYIVTHDLRAPLVNIMGFTSELEAMFKPIDAYVVAGSAASPEQKAAAEEALRVDVAEAIGFIRSSTRKMDGLINAILKISREGRRELRVETVDLTGLIETAAAAVHHQASAEESGGIEIDSQVPRVVSDRLSLDQIMGNLIDNAIKYRAPDRPIKIAVRTRRERRGWVKIEIEDNGRGIAATDHERIFELFRRSGTQNTAGEGIGLAHVRTMVRNLGGDIAVRSELGKGTTFTVTLPPDLAAYRRSAEA
ncbi:His Kinase A (phospho-acceptor) domain-containing protein [Bosea robiniae]|uniref:histidine kinase n=1 Tax=Bosea robiniae TaxID=1036780 RepID=A0ABY0P5M6_9HYPH|nr:ATP-binding protein [Bosea robiniae]SDH31156.1 His Kinase A (phospho-acceptor) domain-containing protein [Bosea robiniae]